jgi:hypothetical protein
MTRNTLFTAACAGVLGTLLLCLILVEIAAQKWDGIVDILSEAPKGEPSPSPLRRDSKEPLIFRSYRSSFPDNPPSLKVHNGLVRS